jgi:hypothetical protein
MGVHMLSNRKINDMWRSGFCLKVIDHARTTSDTVEGAARRMMFLQQHLINCENCRLATMWKDIEASVSERMGPQALRSFYNGEDITELAGFKVALHAMVDKVMQGQARARDLHFDPDKLTPWLRRITAQRREPLVPEDDDD